MPRATYTSVIGHTYEEEYRAWVNELSTALKACLTQTGDTGQIDLTRGVTHSDDFNRADGALGAAWTVPQGTGLVESNQLRVKGVVAGGALALMTGFQVTCGNLTVTVAATSAGASPMLLFRSNGSTICYAWDPTAGGVFRYTTLSARQATAATHAAFVPVAGDVLSVDWGDKSSGCWVVLKRNGVVVFSGVTDTSISSTSNLFGVRCASDATGVLFDNIAYSAGLKPNVATYGGYEMFRFSDPLQSSKPVFLKVEYGTANSQERPQIRVSVGNGTNGAGTLTLQYASSLASQVSGTPSLLPQTTWVCYKDGAFTLAWGQKVPVTTPNLVCGVERARDAAGDSTDDGLVLVTNANAGSPNFPTFYHWSYETGALVGSGTLCLTPHAANSALSSVVNIYNYFTFTPNLRNLLAWFCYKNSEIPAFSEVDIALLGSTARHYVCLGPTLIISAGSTGRVEDTMAILWEA